jgi:hypothetical protein
MRSQPISKVISVVARSTRANSARSSTYIVALSRLSLLRPFSMATILITYNLVSVGLQLGEGSPEELLRAAHIQPLAHDHIIDLPASLDLVNQLVPLPECVQRAGTFDPGTPASTFASSLIAHPAEEALEKLS